MPIYGLTGGIASGKTVALQIFDKHGVDTIDADELARLVIERGTEGARILEEAIGEQYFYDGALDRRLLREDMYQFPSLKQTVESIVHPLVRDALDKWIKKSSKSPYRILCSPLLIETNQHVTLDGVIVIDTPESIQLERGARRDSCAKDAFQKIITAQLPRHARLEHATLVVDNSGDFRSLFQQIHILHEKLSHD
ncbi:MAG: dephospho-CoA kinase [Gammaproteobacteria bacterium]|mgnify:CR=1 FL=1|nr:dephospho-CoA kinase [Gammaproteobacteria bacterium]|tara:strand:+ start:5834 stop:6421 length:588 start_codon:yes stop_codon:yes gene_type:complete